MGEGGGLGIYADMSCSRRSTVMRRPTVVDGEGAGVGGFWGGKNVKYLLHKTLPKAQRVEWFHSSNYFHYQN